MKFSIELVVLGLVSLPGAIAWGQLGHYTTAYLGSYFVSNSTEAYLKDLLGNTDDDYLAGISTFADDFAHSHEGGFTKGWHFIDAHDDPESEECNVDYKRDCKKDGCVISALVNMTELALNSQTSEKNRQFAVKMLVHFIGDLHQPLHNEDIAQGGTQLSVKWEGDERKLHKVWDTLIPEKVTEHLHSREDRRALEWAQELAGEISNGKFAADKDSWLKDFDPSDSFKTVMTWSNEANDFVCDNVFIDNYEPSQIEGKELSKKDYYNQASSLVEKQIARAGYRMAAWLDEIARNNWHGQDNAEL
ncbi:putative nuclease S1 precursor [Trichoderma sp. SZMC 28012]